MLQEEERKVSFQKLVERNKQSQCTLKENSSPDKGILSKSAEKSSSNDTKELASVEGDTSEAESYRPKKHKEPLTSAESSPSIEPACKRVRRDSTSSNTVALPRTPQRDFTPTRRDALSPTASIRSRRSSISSNASVRSEISNAPGFLMTPRKIVRINSPPPSCRRGTPSDSNDSERLSLFPRPKSMLSISKLFTIGSAPPSQTSVKAKKKRKHYVFGF